LVSAVTTSTLDELSRPVDAGGSAGSTGAGRARSQLTLMGAQLAVGVGNLAVSLVAARLLAPGEYAEVVAFLSLYLAVHVPTAALTAAGAIDPVRTDGVRRAAVRIAVIAAAAVLVLSRPIGAVAGLPTAMVVALAIAMPGAAALGVARGRAYAGGDIGLVATSLGVEPVVRGVLGAVLMAVLGASGAAIAVVAGGYLAWWVCVRGAGRRGPTDVVVAGPPPAEAHVAVGVGVSFVLLAVLQVVDLLVANARLDDVSAGQFGALSTLGGAAVFATATIPMVLLPASARGDEQARRTALYLTAATGTIIALVGGMGAVPILDSFFGRELVGDARLLGPYLFAMAAIGMIRVVVAMRWTQDDGPFARRALVGGLIVQVLLLAACGRSVGGVVACTLVSSFGLLAVLALPIEARTERSSRLHAPSVSWRARRLPIEAIALGGLCLGALAIRLLMTRGLWVDEAISVRQAQLPFGEMLRDIRVTDVHPPLHHSLLWVTVRVFGTSELAVRIPSLVAGVALVPAMLWTGRVAFDRRTGWIAAVLAAIAPFCVWYSQEARMYSLFMLFATLAVGAQILAVRRGRRIDWLLYSAATAALIWTQYFALLPVAVQQVAFAVVWWRRRGDRQAARRFLRGWAASCALVLVAVAPLVPVLRAQVAAYGNRAGGLVPGQAGADSSSLGGSISIYAVGANLVWALWGYHADGTMVQLTALWPLLMLLALLLLGRGRSGASTLLAALVAVPLAALFVIGSVKRDLFELRYFCGAVPAIVLLAARLITAVTRRWVAVFAAAGLVAGSLAIGLVDQQLNGANPRLYDFEGALGHVEAESSGASVLLYEPAYLGDVIDYYAPDLDTRPLGSPIPDDADTVWVLASERVLDAKATSAKVGTALADLEQERELVDRVHRPNVLVWELR
jgi:O-antigen/teichoic acid export membrane protein